MIHGLLQIVYRLVLYIESYIDWCDVVIISYINVLYTTWCITTGILITTVILIDYMMYEGNGK